MPFDRFGNWTDDNENAVSMIDSQDQGQEDLGRLEMGQPAQQPAYGVDDEENRQRQIGGFDEAVQNLSPQDQENEGQPGRQSSDSGQQADYGPEGDGADGGGGGNYEVVPEQRGMGLPGVGYGPAPQSEQFAPQGGGGYRKWDGQKWVTQDTPGAPVPLGQQGPKADVLHFINPHNGNRGSFELPRGQDGQRLVQDYQRKGYITSVNRPLDRNGRPILSPQEQQAQQQQMQEKEPADLESQLARATLTTQERNDMSKYTASIQQMQNDPRIKGTITQRRAIEEVQALLKPLQDRDNQQRRLSKMLQDQQHTQMNAKAQGIKLGNDRSDAGAATQIMVERNKVATEAAGDGVPRIVDNQGRVHIDPVAELKIKHAHDMEKIAAQAAAAKEKTAGKPEKPEPGESFDYAKHLAQAKAQVEAQGIEPTVPGTDGKGHVSNPDFREKVKDVMQRREAEHARVHGPKNVIVPQEPPPATASGDSGPPPIPSSMPAQQGPPQPAAPPREAQVREATFLHGKFLDVANNHPDPTVRVNASAAATAALELQKIMSNPAYANINSVPPEVRKKAEELRQKIKGFSIPQG